MNYVFIFIYNLTVLTYKHLQDFLNLFLSRITSAIYKFEKIWII